MKAAKHQLMSKATAGMSGRLPKDTIEILGLKYTIQVVKPEAEDWIAEHTAGTTISAALMNLRKPTLACALVSIEDTSDDKGPVPVEQLFTWPDDMDAKTREFLVQDGNAMRDWRREQVLDWLREEADPFVIDTLYATYNDLNKKYKEECRKTANLSKRTPSPA